MFGKFTRFVIVLLLCVTSKLSAQCLGEMRLSTAIAPIENVLSNEIWVPLKIEVDENLQFCAHSVYLSSSGSERIFLRDKGQKLFLDGMTRNKEALPKESGYYKLKLSGKKATHFWLRTVLHREQTVIPAGFYSGQIEAKVNTLTNKINLLDINFVIEPKASIRFLKGKNVNLSGSGNYVVADLGKLKTHSQHSLQLQLSSNANVSVIVSSLYGKLRHEKWPNEYINYSMRLNNQQLDQQKTAEIDFGYIGHKARIPLELTIGNVDYAKAGIYQDIISVTVNAY